MPIFRNLEDFPIFYEDDLIVIYDVRADMVRHEKRKYQVVPNKLEKLKRLFVHHTAGSVDEVGARGLDGPIRTSRFCAENPVFKVRCGPGGEDWRRATRKEYASTGKEWRLRLGGRGWPGMPYNFFINWNPVVDERGRYVVWHCQDLEVRSYHTGGRTIEGDGSFSNNKYGISVAAQGAFASAEIPDLVPPDPDQNGIPHPSPGQTVALVHFLRVMAMKYGRGNPEFLSTHSRAGTGSKAACPGLTCEGLVEAVRASL